jgi:hypothetical protein
VLELRAGGDLLATHGVDGLAELGGQVIAVEGHPRVRQMLGDSADERRTCAGTGVGDLLRITPVLDQVSGEAARVSAERPSVANTTRRAARSAKILT